MAHCSTLIRDERLVVGFAAWIRIGVARPRRYECDDSGFGDGFDSANIHARIGATWRQRATGSGRFHFDQTIVACTNYNGLCDLHGHEGPRNATIPERDVLRDAYFVTAILRLLREKIVEERGNVETHLLLLNAVFVGAGEPLE